VHRPSPDRVVTAVLAEQPPRCAPLAPLFTSARAISEPDTLRQMRALCAGCSCVTSCRAQARALRADRHHQAAPQVLGGLVVGLPGGWDHGSLG
jgi:hypothetical protein